MNETIFVAVLAVVLVATLVAGRMLYRLFIRVVFALADRLPPHRLGGRYRSQSTPESMRLWESGETAADHPNTP